MNSVRAAVTASTIGIVSPGAMGSALGRVWAAGGARVVATVAGRSERTRRLAHGFDLLPSLKHVVAASDLIVSVCPPSAAANVLEEVLGAAERHGVFVDLNAIQPALAGEMADRCAASGWDFVDGSISGPPPSPHSSSATRVFLSGPNASAVSPLPSPGLETRVVGDAPGDASAIKMCTASVYKGAAALWAQALRAAEHHGVLDLVLDDLAETFPDYAPSVGRTIALAATKSERYVAEMENIAATQASAGLGSELFTAMGEVYRRIATTPLAAMSPEEGAALTGVREVLQRLS